jgi:TatD DNase family protein
MLIDTHAHTNFIDFKDDYKEAIKRALDSNIWVVNASSNLENAKKAVEIAHSFKEGVYAAVGEHPIHEGSGEVDYEAFFELAKDEKVVAIGEIGLDYFHMKEGTKDGQKEMLIKFLEIANRVKKPAIIHCREAHDDLVKILADFKKTHPDLMGVMHFFVGSEEILKKVLDLGFYVSFTGVITFTTDYNGLVRMVPDDRIMSETDCPWVAPVPYRGKKNEPMYVKYVVEKMAEIRGVSFEKMSEQTFANAKRFFRI